MNICPTCGIVLEQDMTICPLCNTPVSATNTDGPERRHAPDPGPSGDVDHRRFLHRVLWQITAVLLISGIVATLTIDLSMRGKVTWSIYPVTVCLILLGYASLMALWRTRFIFQLSGGWIISALLLMLLDRYVQQHWPLELALPLVSAVNVVSILLYLWLTRLKTKGLNVLALIFVALAILSLVIESIIALYTKGTITLGWSVIVSACLLPVTAAILFMYFRTRKNSELQKIFHT